MSRRTAQILIVVMSLILATRALVLLARGSPAYLGIFADDFFYYAGVAKNVARSGVSTFDGFTRTNGYHPLWMAVLCLLALVTGGTGSAFFALLSLVCAALAIASGFLFLRIVERLFPSSAIAPAVVVLVSYRVDLLCFQAMEYSVAVPLIALFVLGLLGPGDPDRAAETTDTRSMIALGWTGAAVVLARLDAVLLVVTGCALVVSATLRRSGPSRALRRATALASGVMPLGAYFLYNQVSFGHALTVSSRAKQLRLPGLHLNLHFLRDLWDIADAKAMVPLALGGLGVLLLAPTTTKTRWERAVLLVALSFPFVFYAAFAVSSDWSLFYWYTYPLPLAATLGAALLDAKIGPRARARKIIPWVLCAAALGGSVVSFGKRVFAWRPPVDSMYFHAVEIARFAETHPGRYAMGDRGGIAAWLLPGSLLQLEGLVADRVIIEHIRKQDDLVAVLAEYRIDYVVVTRAGGPARDGDCWVFTEPDVAQAGAHTPHMSGRFCQAPAMRFVGHAGNAAGEKEPGRMETWIFAIAQR